MYMLDTNVFVEFLRGRNGLILQMLKESDVNLFKVPSVVKAELLLGAAKSKDPMKERGKAESLLLPFEIVPFDDACSYHYARIRANLEKRGFGIGANDYLVAATALAHSAVLVTANVGEFARIPELLLEEWAETEL